MNSFDCGVFICQYAECIALDIQIMDSTQQQIPDIGNQMKVKITLAEILYHKHEYHKKVS